MSAHRLAYLWHRFRPGRRQHAILVGYAILGAVAKHGPCTSDQVARILKRPPQGVAMDLAVTERIWGDVVSDCPDESQPQRRLYRLAEPKAQRGSAAGQGAFWDDLNRRMEDPEFAKAYIKTSLRIQTADAEANGEDGGS